MSSTQAVSVPSRAAVCISCSRSRLQSPIPEPEAHYRLRPCGRQRYPNGRESREKHSAQCEKSTFRVNASSEKMFKREYSFVTRGSAVCANVSMKIQMLRQCYEGLPSTGDRLSLLYSVGYSEYRYRTEPRYTPWGATSQFERFLFPQCFPQEATELPDFSAPAERRMFGRDIRHSGAVLLERH